MTEKLWTMTDCADFLQVPRKTLYDWRYRGLGPPSVKVGKHVRYVPEQVKEWVREAVDHGINCA